MKKLVVGILILVLVLGLVACGGGNDTNATRVENEEVTLITSGNERTGTYSGEVRDGVPHGEGVFVAYNPEGTRWTYTGSFANGLFHGNGVTEWENGQREEGEYIFNADGTGTRGHDEFIDEFTWSADTPGEVLLTLDGGLVEDWNYSIEGRTLTLSYWTLELILTRAS